MMFLIQNQQMNRDLELFEKKVRDLQIENQVLREQLGNSSRMQNSSIPQVIVDLSSKNERLQRQAYKLQSSIKMDLSSYVAESMVQGQCYYRNRYTRLLTQPKNNYKLYF